ncbi:MAG: hydrogenase nickel incorporation protein HypA [Desulfurococcaceae archaeon TW002]
MHEWALAEGVVRYLSSVVGDRRLKSVKIGLGELQSIDEEILKFALTELMKTKGYDLSEDSVLFVRRAARFQCRKCGYSWGLSEVSLNTEDREAIHFIPEVIHAYVSCPKCGSRDFEVVEGRGVEIVEVVVE